MRVTAFHLDLTFPRLCASSASAESLQLEKNSVRCQRMPRTAALLREEYTDFGSCLSFTRRVERLQTLERIEEKKGSSPMSKHGQAIVKFTSV